MELEITSLRVYVLETVSSLSGRSCGYDVFNTWDSAYAYVCRQMWEDGTAPAPMEDYQISAEDTTAHPDHYEIYERDVRDYQFGEAEQEKARQCRRERS